MDIQLNGEPRDCASGTTISALLEAEGLAERRVAVEVNGDIIPRSRHAQATLHAGDRVEIVHVEGAQLAVQAGRDQIHACEGTEPPGLGDGTAHFVFVVQ